MATIELKHQNSHAEILLDDKLNSSSAMKLDKILDMAFSYYNYKEVDIKINSPGGESSSMYFLLNIFNKYKAEGKKIGTTALFPAFSAGAFLLSCGSIEKRKAYKNAKLLYHFARISIKESILTEDNVQRFSDILKKENEVFLSAITDTAICTVNHYRKTLSKPFFDIVIENFFKQANNLGLINENPNGKFNENRLKQIIKTTYSNLFKKDITITPKTALNLFLIDRIIN